MAEKENHSLLKPYTMFDKIKNSTLDELARFYPCPYHNDFDLDEFCRGADCFECTKEYLMSRVEDTEGLTYEK